MSENLNMLLGVLWAGWVPGGSMAKPWLGDMGVARPLKLQKLSQLENFVNEYFSFLFERQFNDMLIKLILNLTEFFY